MGDAGRRHLAYQPALDGVRALAVAAVVVFHGGVAAVSGGFLGVDAFFVLSGFLITSLLLAERAGTGRIDLVAFWGRRARRLLPALLLMLVAVVGVARWLMPPEELTALRLGRARRGRVRRQLADGRSARATTSPRPVRPRRCSTPGHSVSRSSSTWSGRCSCSPRSGWDPGCADSCRCWRAGRSVRAFRRSSSPASPAPSRPPSSPPCCSAPPTSTAPTTAPTPGRWPCWSAAVSRCCSPAGGRRRAPSTRCSPRSPSPAWLVTALPVGVRGRGSAVAVSTAG